jgi:hypothetical protein
MTETGNDPGRTDTGVNTHATAAGTDAEQGTPRPNTGLDTGRVGAGSEDRHIPDPDYGIDPNVASPMYGGTGRGSSDIVAQASGDRAILEGNALPGTAHDADTGGTARAGDMTSTANTFDNTQHGVGESGIRGNMDTGVNRPPASSADTDTRSNHNWHRDGMVDPNDEATFEEGMQHAEGTRA